jgi:hypothetical protein
MDVLGCSHTDAAHASAGPRLRMLAFTCHPSGARGFAYTWWSTRRKSAVPSRRLARYVNAVPEAATMNVAMPRAMLKLTIRLLLSNHRAQQDDRLVGRGRYLPPFRSVLVDLVLLRHPPLLGVDQ